MADDLYQRDTLVLQHLRGYPEELRHYSNLIKQAHPRGMSALDFVLRRPAASDSFIAAICRLVAAGEAVLSAVEAAERFGGPPPTFLETITARPDFPPPLFPPDDKRVWRGGAGGGRRGAWGSRPAPSGDRSPPGGPSRRRYLPMTRSGSGGPATWRSTGSSMGKLRLLVTCKHCGRGVDTR